MECSIIKNNKYDIIVYSSVSFLPMDWVNVVSRSPYGKDIRILGYSKFLDTSELLAITDFGKFLDSASVVLSVFD